MNLNNLLGKRFLFGIVAMVCITVAAIVLKFNGDIYFKLVGILTGSFLTAQTVTDSIKITKNKSND